ncbi:hypothetical protein B0H67DRAFT_648968 [Lasiosphaeris hirsuta]|uniref:Uncharacterized protein n=1 Tax=Lasiosphaeris hirsuta TaxID=260670 RepID=A0AA40DKW4_9PEZI|nr:hypothetical protein B0H67DRAFT_648968 [Lasiosphaeris hirsuta]
MEKAYFLAYFLPVLLTLCLLLPIQALDAEVKQILPFRALASSSSSPSHHGLDVLSTPTSELAARRAGWGLLLGYGDPIGALGDLFVAGAACVVAVSGETVGLKLRGSCLRWDTSACLVTVAVFPGPARAAEVLLGGLVVLFTWDKLCTDFNEQASYMRTAQRPQPANFSMLQAPPTNFFAGLVPFASTQTWRTHEICTWMTIAVLSVMVITLLTYIWPVKWPYMPVALNTLASRIYYICDSVMLRDFERLSMLGAAERDRRVKRAARLYRFGSMVGVSGQRRIGIDYAEGEQGFMLHSLHAMGFGVAGKMRPT